MSGVTTSSLSLAWTLRNWVILDYEEANGLTVRPWEQRVVSNDDVVTAVSRSHLDLGLKKNFPSSRSPIDDLLESERRQALRHKALTSSRIPITEVKIMSRRMVSLDYCFHEFAITCCQMSDDRFSFKLLSLQRIDSQASWRLMPDPNSGWCCGWPGL